MAMPNLGFTGMIWVVCRHPNILMLTRVPSLQVEFLRRVAKRMFLSVVVPLRL